MQVDCPKTMLYEAGNKKISSDEGIAPRDEY